MSRIGKKPVPQPAGVEIRLTDERTIVVKGPKGSLSRTFNPAVSVALGDGAVTVTVRDPLNPKDRALWGLTRALIQNMVRGVTEGYMKKLEINGVGYRVAAAGATLNLELGFSHPVAFTLPQGVQATVEKNIITLNGIDNELLGETAARIRRLRPVEPYKGKGIKYVDEYVRRKAGKAAKAGAAK